MKPVVDRSATNLAAYDNRWYQPGGSVVQRVAWFAVNAAFFVNPLNPLSGLKVRLLRLFGAKVGRGVVIKPAVNIKYPWRLTVGDHVWIGERVWIDNLEKVTIGDHACLSQEAMLLTGSHDYTKTTFDLRVAPIKVEAGAWVGARATVAPGVTCGSHSVLAVGSVATRSLAPYTVYQGNPAEPKRERVIE